MDADPPLEHRQDLADLGDLAIVDAEALDGTELEVWRSVEKEQLLIRP